MQLKCVGGIRSKGGEQVRGTGSSLYWIFSFFHFGFILCFWQKNDCLWGESWDVGFSKYIYIFLLNLSENNYGNSSAEARTDVLLKLQLSSVNMHKSWEGGGGELVLCFYKTSLEKLEKSENTPPPHQARRSPCPFRLWSQAVRGGLAARNERIFAFRAGISRCKTRNQKTQKRNKGGNWPLPVSLHPHPKHRLLGALIMGEELSAGALGPSGRQSQAWSPQS